MDEIFIRRCIELAQNGLGNVQPNPMVGAVIVYNGQIIGEGYHKKYGEAHAEINAIDSVTEKNLLRESTMYVSLEPCSHYGKTPPCADKIIELGIPRVVIGSIDPNEKVNGSGIARLQAAGISVKTGVLKTECDTLNCRFFTYHQKHRPYVILKWAQTADGFMDIDRTTFPNGNYWITNQDVRVITHRWRSEEQAIAIGYKTYLHDHPQLTTRFYEGKNPSRYIMARNSEQLANIEGFTFLSDNPELALQQLYAQKIQSVIVEGGRTTLDSFITAGLWDEARVLTGNVSWGRGTTAPPPPAGTCIKTDEVSGNTITIYKSTEI